VEIEIGRGRDAHMTLAGIEDSLSRVEYSNLIWYIYSSTIWMSYELPAKMG